MKKIIFGLFLAFLTTGCTNEQGKIYTGLPDRSDKYYRPFKKDIRTLRADLKSSSVNYGDIWIRDVAPVVTSRLVKFRYLPDYLSIAHSRQIDSDFRSWLDDSEFDYLTSDIILDGGNFVSNGKDTAIITTRILKDNSQYSKNELLDKLEELLQIDKIVLISPEPGDVLAHADGQVHFIQSDVLFVGEFENSSEVKAQLRRALPDVKLVDLPSNYQSAGQYDDEIPSAKGLYINMMETKNTVFVPQYNLSLDKRIINLVRKYTDKKVQPINVSSLSTLGGSVNCLTWYCPENLLPK